MVRHPNKLTRINGFLSILPRSLSHLPEHLPGVTADPLRDCSFLAEEGGISRLASSAPSSAAEEGAELSSGEMLGEMPVWYS
jgi:hypothetical protein